MWRDILLFPRTTLATCHLLATLHPIKYISVPYFPQVIEAAERDGAFEQLVLYLRMARKEVKEAIIENELIYSLAKTNALGDLEEIIAAPNVANIEVSYGDAAAEACGWRIVIVWLLLCSSLASSLSLLSTFEHPNGPTGADVFLKGNDCLSRTVFGFVCVVGDDGYCVDCCGLGGT